MYACNSKEIANRINHCQLSQYACRAPKEIVCSKNSSRLQKALWGLHKDSESKNLMGATQNKSKY